MRRADEVLEQVFELVVKKAREDKHFAEDIVTALGKELSVERPKRERKKVVIPEELRKTDIASLIRRDGMREAQAFLVNKNFTAEALRAYAREKGMAIRSGSRKSEVIATILRASMPSRAEGF